MPVFKEIYSVLIGRGRSISGRFVQKVTGTFWSCGLVAKIPCLSAVELWSNLLRGFSIIPSMTEINQTRLAGMMVLGCGAVAAGSLLRMAWLRREILRSVSRLGEMTTAAVERQVALRSLAKPDRNLKADADQLRLLEAGVTTQVSIARKNHQRHRWLVDRLRQNWAVRAQFLPQWRADAFEGLDEGVEAHGTFLETLEQQTAAAQRLIAQIRQT